MSASVKKRVLITVKTYPIPSAKYDELVCTAGVTEDGEFIRLYPINFRELPYEQQYKKYQWIEVAVEKHTRGDSRKESYRPDCGTLKTFAALPTKSGDWDSRAEYVMPLRARSMEDLRDQWDRNHTSLGFFRPKKVHDFIALPDDPAWNPRFLAELRQARLFEDRGVTREPPRKVPYVFKYRYEGDDALCRGHEMMVADWEVGRLYWRLKDGGASDAEAIDKMKQRFLHEICGADRDTHFYVGTIHRHPKGWIVIGLFYPKKRPRTGRLFK